MGERERVKRGAWLRIAVIAGATLLGLCALEVALRVKAYLEDRGILTEALDQRPGPAPGEEVNLGQIIRLSQNHRIVYELLPNLSVVFEGQPLSTNSAGFRDAEIRREKPPGVRRILGLGDSFMFGWKLPDGADYLSQLEGLLNRGAPGPSWEAINTAAPGYNTVMEVATLESKGLAYAPDLVVLGLVGNDIRLPNFIRAERRVFSLSKSYLADFASRRLALLGREEDEAGGRTSERLAPAPRELGDGMDSARFAYRPEEVPERYRELVGWEAQEAALGRLLTLSRSHRFEVLVVYLSPGGTAAARRAFDRAAELGLHALDVGAEVRRYMEERDIRKYRGSELSISPEDGHPSALTHQLAAGRIRQWMEDNGLLAR